MGHSISSDILVNYKEELELLNELIEKEKQAVKRIHIAYEKGLLSVDIYKQRIVKKQCLIEQYQYKKEKIL